MALNLIEVIGTLEAVLRKMIAEEVKAILTPEVVAQTLDGGLQERIKDEVVSALQETYVDRIESLVEDKISNGIDLENHISGERWFERDVRSIVDDRLNETTFTMKAQ
jgi:hypothetical protein